MLKMLKLKQTFSADRILGDSLRAYLVRGTTGVFILQALTTALGFLTNVLLARFLGSVEYGVYTYVYAWVGILTVLSMFGFGDVLIREIASYQARQEWGLIAGILRSVGRYAVYISIGVAAASAVIIYLFPHLFNPQIFPAIWFALLLLPTLTIFNLTGQALVGNKKVIQAKVTGVLVRAPLFIVLLVLVFGLMPAARTAAVAIFLGLCATCAALLGSLYLLYKSLPHDAVAATPEYQVRRWFKSALPLLLIAGLFELNTRMPILILGSFSDLESAGFYAVAALIAGFIGFILMSVNLTVSPVFSTLYTSGDMRRLQRIVTQSTRIMVAVCLIMALSIVVLRNWLLSFFGPAFHQASSLLVLLSVGQVVNVFAGSVGTLLVMTGHERWVVRGVGASTLLMAVMYPVLISQWGVNGAGVATIIGIAVWNLILVRQVYAQLGIDPTALGLLGKYHGS